MKMVHCPRCGTENDADNDHCAVCDLDLNSITALICPICQYENPNQAEVCKQCGSHFVNLSAAGSSGQEQRGYRPDDETGHERDFSGIDDVSGDGSDSAPGEGASNDDMDDWLTELTATKSGTNDDEDQKGPGASPYWLKDSENKLADTGTLEPEKLPDWLKNLKKQEVPEAKKPQVKKARLPDWLKDSGELDESRVKAAAIANASASDSLEGEGEPETDDNNQKEVDNWLVELATMGTTAGDEDQEDETRFVWDDSALASDVSAELGDEAPDWLVELTQSEGWPDKLTESVVSEWLDQQKKSPKQPDVRIPPGTRPLTATKELSGVPEQLVSQDLPEWLGESTKDPREPALLEEDEVHEGIDLEKELGELPEFDEELSVAMQAMDLAEPQEFVEQTGIRDEEPSVFVEEPSLPVEERPLPIEDPSVLIEEPPVNEVVPPLAEEEPAVPVEVPPVPEEVSPVPEEVSPVPEEVSPVLEVEPPVHEVEPPVHEDEPSAFVEESPLSEEEPISDEPESIPAMEDTLELVFEDLPKLLQKAEKADDYPDFLETDYETLPSEDLEPIESFVGEVDGLPAADSIEESEPREIIDSDEASTALVVSDEIKPLQDDGDVFKEDVPGWLGLLTSKLLDTFDNEFVTEWFSRGEQKDEVEEAATDELTGEKTALKDDFEAAPGLEAVAASETKLEVAPEIEAEAPSILEPKPKPEPEPEPVPVRQIDPFFGEVIPDWVIDEDQEPVDAAEAGVVETIASEPDLEPVVDESEMAHISAELKGESADEAEPDAADGADEWLEMLDHVEDEDDAITSLQLELQALTEPGSEAAELRPEFKVATGLFLLEDDEPPGDGVDEIPSGPLVPIVHGTQEVGNFTLTKEQKQQVALLQQLVHAESKKPRSLAGRSRLGATPNFRLIVGLILVLLIAVGWLVPGLLDFLPGTGIGSVSEIETGVYEELNNAAGLPILVAFEYTPATAGEMDIVANTLIQQIAQNSSPVIAVSQVAAGTAVADRILNEIDGLDFVDLGYLPGDAVGLRKLALCIDDGGDCESAFGQPLHEEAAAALGNLGMILVLAADRDSMVDWIEQVGTKTEAEMAAGIIQPLEPVVLPYLSSGQLIGAVVGAPSAAAYFSEYLQGDIEGFQFTSFALVQWFVIGMLIAGVLYFGAAGLWSSRDYGAAER